MTEQEALEQAAEKYRQEGYTVLIRPSSDDLPGPIEGHRIDLLARRGAETVAVQVECRDRHFDVVPTAEIVKAQPGWSYDLIVVPVNGSDELPPGTTASATDVQSFLAEAERLLEQGTPRSAFLIAWSAVEAVLREAARREELGVESRLPRSILKALLAHEIISREDHEKLQHSLDMRSRLVHGLSPDALEGTDVRYLVAVAKQLLSAAPAPSES